MSERSEVMATERPPGSRALMGPGGAAPSEMSETDLVYLRDAYVRTDRATVVGVDGARVALDRTILYPTGGGQPHDNGTLTWDGSSADVVDVRKDGSLVWFTLADGS